MKALSLWQPWASAIAVGSKRIETRHWSTNYRGPLAIHAAKRCVKRELFFLQLDPDWQGALRPIFGWTLTEGAREPWKVLPFGAIVAVADLVDCRRTESFTVGEIDTPRRPEGDPDGIYDWTESAMGNFEPGRFGWVLANVCRIADPIPYRGAQGLFEVPDDLLRRAANDA